MGHDSRDQTHCSWTWWQLSFLPRESGPAKLAQERSSGWGRNGNGRNELAVDSECSSGWKEDRKAKDKVESDFSVSCVVQVWRETCQLRALSELHGWQEESSPVWLSGQWGEWPFTGCFVFSFRALVAASVVRRVGCASFLSWHHGQYRLLSDGCADGVSVPAVLTRTVTCWHL